MENYKCEVCDDLLLPYQTVIYGSYGDQQHLCMKCYNKMITDEFDFEFEHKKFPPTTLEDSDGLQHEFHFSYQVVGDKISFSAVEVKGGEYEGYMFKVLGSVDEGDLRSLYLRLFSKVCKELSRKHIEQTTHGWHFTEDYTVRGRIEVEPEDTTTPVLVIDGKKISWEKFGRLITSCEGFTLKMQIFDSVEDC